MTGQRLASERRVQLRSFHLDQLPQVKFTCKVRTATDSEGGSFQDQAVFGVLTVDREVRVDSSRGTVTLVPASPSERVRIEQAVSGRKTRVLATVSLSRPGSPCELTVFGTAADIVVDWPVPNNSSSQEDHVSRVIARLPIPSTGVKGAVAFECALQVVLSADCGIDGQVAFLEWLTSEESRNRNSPAAPIHCFRVIATDDGDTLESIDSSHRAEEFRTSVRLVEFRAPPMGAAPILRSLLAVRPQFLSDWFDYESRSELRERAQFVVRANSPIRATTKLNTGEGTYHQYRFIVTEAIRSAWVPSGGFREIEVEIVQATKQSGGTKSCIFARLVAIVADGTLGTASLDFIKGFPKTSEFEIVPAADSANRTQRERKVRAYNLIVGGQVASTSLVEALLRPSDVANRPIESIRFPVLRTPTPAQTDAVRKALGTASLALIQGPPGTGKTDVICQIVAEHVDRNSSVDSAISRVLVAAQQHAAIDNLVLRLSERANIEVWRVASGNQVETMDRGHDEEWQRKVADFEANWCDVSGAILPKLVQLYQLQILLAKVEDLVQVLGEGVTLQRMRGLAGELEAHPPEVNASVEALRSALGTAARIRELASSTDSVQAQVLGAILTLKDDPPKLSALNVTAGDGELHELITLYLDSRQRNHSSKALDRAWNAVVGRVEELEQQRLTGGSTPAEDSSIANALECAQNATQLATRVLEASHPIDAIRARLLSAIKNNPAAWKMCRERHASSIGATCQGAELFNVDREYDLVIVDEAAQVGLDVLIPISKARKVVLVGDHRQLPPYIEREVFCETDGERPETLPSLFEQLWEKLPAQSKQVLDTQFRMHETIGRVVSAAFYEPQIKLNHHRGDRTASLNLFGNAPMVWINTGGKIPNVCGEQPENDAEESMVEFLLLERMLNRMSIASAQSVRLVGIACMYSRQRDLVRHRLESTTFDRIRDRITCDTTDSFQGQEFEHVFVLCTRRGSGPGFLRAPSRLNVAISRARRQVILLADQQLVGSAPHSLGRVHAGMLAVGAGCRFATMDEVMSIG